MRVMVPNVCGECGRAYPELSPVMASLNGLDCGHPLRRLGVGIAELGDHAGSVSRYAVDQARAVARQEAGTIENALRDWVEKSGLSVDEFGRRFGYRVERRWEGTTYHFRVIAVHQRDGSPVTSFSEQPAPGAAEKS